ncbi:unnamed protein product [Pseudo-nitzschia multistriata]|uniref:Uncharacterized protein n=1 Tax=Pseudo-nitzschia multistriata TaxID=183589 RepID=A0A448Z952_9STRA|nr:unnamed protein product [Pseudo-nitzschia multistriata]
MAERTKPYGCMQILVRRELNLGYRFGIQNRLAHVLILRLTKTNSLTNQPAKTIAIPLSSSPRPVLAALPKGSLRGASPASKVSASAAPSAEASSPPAASVPAAAATEASAEPSSPPVLGLANDRRCLAHRLADTLGRSSPVFPPVLDSEHRRQPKQKTETRESNQTHPCASEEDSFRE